MASVTAPSSPPEHRAWRLLRRLALAGLALVAVGAGAVVLAANTRAVNQGLDSRALAMMANVAAQAAARSAPARPSPPFFDAGGLDALTRPPPGGGVVPQVQPAPRTLLGRRDVVEEGVTFPSAISLQHLESNTVRLRVFRHGRLGERPAVVWVPGLYVSELAMTPISWFIERALDRGADVVLLEPPYHLGRTPAGYRSGDAFFSTTIDDHLNAFAQELSDVRRVAAWLRGLGAPRVGGFGGSLGALVLLRVATWDDAFDFLTVFIPVVRPRDFIDRPEAEPMRQRLAAEGGSLAQMMRVYDSLDLVAATPRLAPARISVLFGRYDIVARPDTIATWAKAWGVTRLHAFDRGHTLALFNRAAYRDYAQSLDEDLHAFGL